MMCTQLRGQFRLDQSTWASKRRVPGLGSRSRVNVAPIPRACAVVLAGLTLLSSLAGTSYAQSGNAKKSNNKVQAPSAGIRDPMNPEAYMNDLASRMNSPGDQNLLLGGVSTSRTSPPQGGQLVQGFPKAAPRAASQSAFSTLSQPRVPATGVWNATPSGHPVTAAAPTQPGPVVPSTFGMPRAPVGQTSPATPQSPSAAVPNASAGVPTPSSQTTAAASSQPARVVPNVFAGAPASRTQAPATTPEPPSEVVPTASAGVPTSSGPTTSAAPSQTAQAVPNVFAGVPASRGRATAMTPEPPGEVVPAASAGLPAPLNQTTAATPGRLVQMAPNMVAATPEAAPQTTLIMPGQPVPLAPVASPVLLENRTSPVYPALNSSDDLFTRGPGSVERQLIAARPGLTLWSEPGSANQIAQGVAQAPSAPPEPQGPWTLGGDLEKYRAHAVKDGSRDSGENLKKALERTGMTLSDGVNIFVLGYASDRAKPFRQNDGKGLFQEPGKVPAAAGAAIGSLGVGLYALADLLTLNALPDPNGPVYKDNNPLVRPVIFAGRTVHGVWKTTEEVGNAVTWGLFDNVTGCLGLVIEDIVEVVKHAGEAVTNVVRAPFHLAAGKKKIEGTDRALDWILLVPLELVSNAVEMKGFANMQDYKTAFAEKGVIGSVLEFGGSTYIVYRAVDDLLDNHKNKPKRSQNQNQNQNSNSGQNQNQTPTDTSTLPPWERPQTPDTQIPDPTRDTWFFFYSDGTTFTY